MDAGVRRRIEMGDDVLVYFVAHPPTEEPFQSLHPQLVEAVTAAKSLVEKERQGRDTAYGARNYRRVLRQQAELGPIRLLVRAGQAVAAESAPELAGTFKATALRGPNRSFVGKVRSMVATAREHLEAFGKYGVSAGTLDRILAMVDQFETVDREAEDQKQVHVAARAELIRLAATITKLVDLMDPVIGERGQSDPDLLAAWSSARRLAGRSRPAKEAPGSMPVGAEQVAPAA
ncbi:MAG: hypothetical protein R2909_09690 [Gemmatimonadales bacterium]